MVFVFRGMQVLLVLLVGYKLRLSRSLVNLGSTQLRSPHVIVKKSSENGEEPELLEIKKQEALLRSQLDEIERAKARVLATRRLRIGIVGYGRFGQFLARAFVRAKHEVSVLSRSDRAAAAAEIGCFSYLSLEEDSEVVEFSAQNLDVIVLAVSIVSFESTLARLGPALEKASPSPLLTDVLSVKEHARKTMLTHLPRSTSILCTHPMFGPDSGRDSWQSLPFVYDRVRIHDDAIDRCERFLSIFESEGCRMVQLTCRQHDVYAANSQFLTHLVGRTLGETGLSLHKTPIDTKGFESVLRLVETTCDDSFDLFYGLYRYNTHSKSTLLCLRKALADLELRLIDLDLQAERESTKGGSSSRGSMMISPQFSFSPSHFDYRENSGMDTSTRRNNDTALSSSLKDTPVALTADSEHDGDSRAQ